MKSFREKWEFPLSQLIEIITLWSPAGGGSQTCSPLPAAPAPAPSRSRIPGPAAQPAAPKGNLVSGNKEIQDSVNPAAGPNSNLKSRTKKLRIL